MLGVLGFYTTLVVVINIVAHTSSNLVPPGTDVDHLSKQDMAERVYGSKLTLVVEQSQICSIWGAKACLLILYLRLTTLRRENIAIKVLAGYVACGFVFMEVFYFAVWCRPFHNYWAVPTPSVQCDAATDHLITNAVLNLTSDVAMLAIGLPMFVRMSLPWRKKIPLIGIFSLGVFVILSAILNKVYSFSQPFGAMWTFWYVRESSTALLVANLPFVWTVWRKITGGGSKTASGTAADGMSRQTSDLPECFTQKPEQRQGSAVMTPTSATSMEAADGVSDDNLPEGKQRSRRSLTLADVLNEGHAGSGNEKEPNPITHPQLFYSSDRLASVDQVSGRVMQSSSANVELGGTPESSLFPHSLARKRSADSFV